MQQELIEQEEVVNHIKKHYPECLFTASAGGMRTNIGTAIKMKRMGYSRGTPDLFIEDPRHGFHGLRIEMKVPDGGTKSKEQKKWIESLNKRGYCALFCNGAKEAIKAIDAYMKEGILK
jgi:hypothetical protein